MSCEGRQELTFAASSNGAWKDNQVGTYGLRYLIQDKLDEELLPFCKHFYSTKSPPRDGGLFLWILLILSVDSAATTAAFAHVVIIAIAATAITATAAIVATAIIVATA